MDFSKEMKGAFVQRRGEPESAVLRLPFSMTSPVLTFSPFPLSAKEKAERRRGAGGHPHYRD